MIKDDTRQTLKFVMWLVIALVVLYFGALAVFYRATNPVRSETRAANTIALQKTPIRHVAKNYHLDRGVNSYSLVGQSKDRTWYYFIYLPAHKQGHLIPARRGVSETTIRNKFAAKNPHVQITKVNLGWYRGRAVWEVASKDAAGNYYYRLYEFKTGNLLAKVAN